MKQKLKKPICFLSTLVLFSVLLSSCKENTLDPIPTDEIATISTVAPSLVTPISAVCGGNITSDGGNKITLRGVCWAIAKTPTIDDFKTTDSISSGNFTSKIERLKASTTYNVRAYAVNSKGVGYGDMLSFKTSELMIGNNFQGGKLAYVLQVGDLGYIDGQSHGFIAATTDQGDSVEWGCMGTPLAGADGSAIGSGFQNTLDIITGCNTAGIAAKLCFDLDRGGYTDWFLPSKNELNLLYLNKAAIGGLDNKDYWSSSEYLINFSWYQSFTTGKIEYSNKDYKGNVRAIRAF